jgi:radical SAM enzyme (TIGR01210 family)
MIYELSIYPEASHERDKWILERRPPKSSIDPSRPYAFSIEEECSASGEIVSVATIFLTNRECPWRCLMCDLWRNTLSEAVPVGVIPSQIDHALAQLPVARHVKLYNSGSFFDRLAIPPQDYPAIAARLDSYERVIVESHPALLGDGCLRLRDLLKGKLEVAMGLETAHADVLSRLNKRMTLDQFYTASQWLKRNGIDLRSFILVKPPFMEESEALFWAERSLDFAFECNSTVAALIPTRGGNGALDELALQNEFSPPTMKILETAAQYGVTMKKGRVLVDLWDLERVSTCESCYQDRRRRLNEINLRQWLPSTIDCACGGE